MVLACSKRAEAVVPDRARDLIVEGPTIQYKGKFLRLGADHKEWFAVLGDPQRVNEYRDHFTWDDLGIAVRLDHNNKRGIRLFRGRME